MVSNKGFLTDWQREVLEKASQNAEMEVVNAPTVGMAVRHARRSHFRKRGRVKKDGAGGKFIWGKLLDTYDDSNHDICEDMVTIIEEYFRTGDVDMAAIEFQELGCCEYHHFFVEKLVTMAMDRHNRGKEMAWVLLSYLYEIAVISSYQISQGFVLLLTSADDLALDIFDAVDILALFIARAMVEDILPLAFLIRAEKKLSKSSKGLLVLQIAEMSYLSAPHHAELVKQRWGSSTFITVEEVKKKIEDLLREYVVSGDTVEACRCIRELGVSFFHHEVVKRALDFAIYEDNQTVEPLIMKLLKEADEEGVISSSQMAKGFGRLAESLGDLSLGKALFQFGISEGWLDSTFLKSSGKNGELQNEDDKNLRWFKKEAVTIIQKYFLSDDMPELIQSLEELAAPKFNPVFLKKLITLAMDRKNKEKEMTSILLSALKTDKTKFSTEDIVKGFEMLLESAEDTTLDILDASNELALFLARAVIDDVLDPLNLMEISCKLLPNCCASETVHMARSLVDANDGRHRILRCWEGGTGWAVEDTEDNITTRLEEYYESRGLVDEACQCIRNVGMPFLNHEVVKKALIMAMEKKNDKMLSLLKGCFGEGLITINQMTKGFAMIRDGLDALALDIPNAEEKFGLYLEQANRNGWLLPSFASLSPKVDLVKCYSDVGYSCCYR